MSAPVEEDKLSFSGPDRGRFLLDPKVAQSFLRTARQNLTTVRVYSSPAAPANASSYGAGSKCHRRTSYVFLVFDDCLMTARGAPPTVATKSL